MVNSNDYILIEENQDVFTFKIRLDLNSEFKTVFSTNISSICYILEKYVENKLEDYLLLENMMGNLGYIPLGENLGAIIIIIDKILKKDISGIYFELKCNAVSSDEEINNLCVDSRDNTRRNDYYYFFINMLLDSLLVDAIDVIEDDKEVAKVIDFYLSDILLANLDDFYIGKINKEDFMRYLLAENEIDKKNYSKVFEA